MKLRVVLGLFLALLGIVAWQEWRVQEAQEAAGAVRRAAVQAEVPLQVDDSTTVTRGLEGILLERDASIRRLTRELKATSRAQLTLEMMLDLRDVELAEAELQLEQVRSAPADSGLTRYEVPFTLDQGDSLDGVHLAGHVALDQPGPDWLPSLAVRLDVLQNRSRVEIDLVEGEDGWRAITRTGSPALTADVTLAVQPRELGFWERLHPLAGLGVQDGHPRVIAGARLDPWGTAVSAGAGAVGVYVFRAF
ncbi:MAG: hypothetical protein WC326_08570 [Candidatus Delongbacteria bacterium]